MAQFHGEDDRSATASVELRRAVSTGQAFCESIWILLIWIRLLIVEIVTIEWQISTGYLLHH